MPECQAYGCLNKAGEGARKVKRFFQIPNATKYPAKRDLAIKWLYNIGTGHTVDKLNFHRKVVCEDHFTEQCFKKNVEHVLLGLPEWRLLKEHAVPTYSVHRQQTCGASGSGCLTSRTRRVNAQNVGTYTSSIPEVNWPK